MADLVAALQSIETLLSLEQMPWAAPMEEAEFPQAAVLVALSNEADPQVLLGRRAMHLTLHPGEIAFAGGKREAVDASPWETAMREAQEEVGLEAHAITPLGELLPLVTRTGFEVFPCIAAIPSGIDYIVDPAEFDSVLQPRLSVFADHGIFHLEEMQRFGTTVHVPHYTVDDDSVWGVTAAILAQLANVAYDAGFDLRRYWKAVP